MGVYKGKSMSVSQKITWTVVSILFGIVAASYTFVLIWGFVSGTKTGTEFGTMKNPFELPKEWHFENYIRAFSAFQFDSVNLLGMTFNSLWYSVGGALICTTCQMGLAYVTAKYKFRGSGLIYMVCMITMIMPIYGSTGAMYRLVYGLGLNDSFGMLLTSATGIGTGFLMFYAFFQNLSWTYAEAALIDGANHFTIFWRIMFPQCIGLFGSLVLMQWLAGWNDYQGPIMYLNEMPTIAVGLYRFKEYMGGQGDMSLYVAASMLSCIPALILFTAFSNTLLKNMSLGGLKE